MPIVDRLATEVANFNVGGVLVRLAGLVRSRAAIVIAVLGVVSGLIGSVSGIERHE